MGMVSVSTCQLVSNNLKYPFLFSGCSYGLGSYKIYLNNDEVRSGASFEAPSETVQFGCINTASPSSTSRPPVLFCDTTDRPTPLPTRNPDTVRPISTDRPTRLPTRNPD